MTHSVEYNTVLKVLVVRELAKAGGGGNSVLKHKSFDSFSERIKPGPLKNVTF